MTQASFLHCHSEVFLVILQAVIVMIGKDTDCHANTSSQYSRTIHCGHLRNYQNRKQNSIPWNQKDLENPDL